MHLIGSKQGTYLARAIPRLPPAENHDSHLLLGVRGSPWSTRTGRYEEEVEEREQPPEREGVNALEQRTTGLPSEEERDETPRGPP